MLAKFRQRTEEMLLYEPLNPKTLPIICTGQKNVERMRRLIEKGNKRMRVPEPAGSSERKPTS